MACYGWLGLTLACGTAKVGNVQIGFAMVSLAWQGTAMLCNGLLGFAMVDLVWLQFGVAPLWLAKVDLALLWLTWLVFGLAWHRNGRQWAAMVGLACLFYG